MLLAAWSVLLVIAIAWVQMHLKVSADLRLFMPAPRTEAQRLLVQNVGESPASRLLLLAMDGDAPEKLAAISRRFAAALAPQAEFGFVANGEQAPPAIPERLLPYRYLITDSFDTRPLDEARLTAELEDRAADMASPAAGFLEEWLPRDPTLELLHLASRWQPRAEPQHVDGVWFTADGKRALLLVETRAAAFDPDGQSSALAALQAEFARARADSPARLTVSGTGYFSSVIRKPYAVRGHLVRQFRHHRPGAAAVVRVPPLRLHLVRRVAAAERRPGRARGRPVRFFPACMA